jgi:Methyltransferase domain
VQPSEDKVREWAAGARTRLDLWVSLVNGVEARAVAEIGVYRGAFAERLLGECPTIAAYYMVDPWRHLDDWNKPANKADDVFERLFEEAMARTGAYAEKRIVLRGKTSEVIDRVPDKALDFAYVDGDHTLRGITVDLVKVFPKVKEGGWIGGDDFSASIWQHGRDYEPTLVFPFAVYFAEAVGARIYGLPHNQFLLEKTARGHEFVDVTGRYGDLDLRGQLDRDPPPRRARAGAQGRPADVGRRPSFAKRVRRRLAF